MVLYALIAVLICFAILGAWAPASAIGLCFLLGGCILFYHYAPDKAYAASWWVFNRLGYK